MKRWIFGLCAVVDFGLNAYVLFRCAFCLGKPATARRRGCPRP